LESVFCYVHVPVNQPVILPVYAMFFAQISGQHPGEQVDEHSEKHFFKKSASLRSLGTQGFSASYNPKSWTRATF
jgi:hypothetical protein